MEFARTAQPMLVPPFVGTTDKLPAPTCDALTANSLRASVFGSLAWYEHLARTSLADGAIPWYLVLDADDKACIPLVRREAGGLKRLEALANFYSPQFEPVVGHAHSAVLASGFASHAADASTGADIIDLKPLDTDSAFFADVQSSLRGSGFWVDSYFCFGNWYLELDGASFSAYFQERPSQLRNTWRRNRKKLEQRELFIEILRENSPALEVAIADYVTIYNGSWKHPEPFPDFIPGLVRMAAEHGWLRMGVLRLEGKAVAAQIWFVKDGTASIYKLAYIAEYAKQSVGTVLTHELMRSAIDEDRVRVIDYLSGDDAYKKDWMTKRRERRGVIAFNQRRARGILAAARHFGGRWLRSLRNPPKPAPAPSTAPDHEATTAA